MTIARYQLEAEPNGRRYLIPHDPGEVRTWSRLFGTSRVELVAERGEHPGAIADRIVRCGLDHRDVVVDPPKGTATRPLDMLAAELLQVMLPPVRNRGTPGMAALVTLLVQHAPRATTTRTFESLTGVRVTSGILSRFHRAGLPTPKQWLAWLRALYVAGLVQRAGWRVGRAVLECQYASAQSGGRSLLQLTGQRPRAWCASSEWLGLAWQVRELLVDRHIDRYSRFDPLRPVRAA